MSSTAAAPSRIVPVPVAAYHVLKIDGHSRTLGTQRAGLRCLESCPFRAGGHTWRVSYYPMGTGPATADYIAIFLVLVDSAAGEDEDVLARVTFSLLDQDQKPVPSCSLTTDACNFSRIGSTGYTKFVRREDLERSGLIKDDCFALRVDVHLVISTPSSDSLHRHLGGLLSSSKGADVEFHVGGETFAAHRLVLRARSPVFKAQLHPSSHDRERHYIVEIDDMEPRVFKALLTFIYTDAWPEMEENEFAMAGGLLAAAGRYGLQRLKLMCDNWLCNRIDTASVSTILALSQKHGCAHLKEACFDFITSSTVRSAIDEQTEGFQRLAQSCAHMADELVVDAIINRDNEHGGHRWNQGDGGEVSVIKISNVARANSTDDERSPPWFYLFSGFVISIIVNSYIGP